VLAGDRRTILRNSFALIYGVALIASFLLVVAGWVTGAEEFEFAGLPLIVLGSPWSHVVFLLTGVTGITAALLSLAGGALNAYLVWRALAPKASNASDVHNI
jgi:hypothetical protein